MFALYQWINTFTVLYMEINNIEVYRKIIINHLISLDRKRTMHEYLLFNENLTNVYWIQYNQRKWAGISFMAVFYLCYKVIIIYLSNKYQIAKINVLLPNGNKSRDFLKHVQTVLPFSLHDRFYRMYRLWSFPWILI